MARVFHTDIAVLGGGIGGLWILNHLREQGYRVLLVERDALGKGQTIASQGMIHGGIKYTLDGTTSEASESIADMPALWRQCLAGDGPVDLTQVRLLSDDYYLFSDARLSSRLTAFFGSRSLRGRIDPVRREEYPTVFTHRFKGALYRLQDLVVDTVSLLDALQQNQARHIVKADAVLTQCDDGLSLRFTDGSWLQARYYVLAAGAGNEEILAGAGLDRIAMQRRPLHQVMVKASHLPSLYAHAVSLQMGTTPRLTITTHYCEDGKPVWYLGGGLAETGVARTDKEQIAFAERELQALLPWISLQGCQWASLRIDRAEPAQPEHNRPGHAFTKQSGQIIVCWTAKLTLAPRLAELVMSILPAPDNTGDELLPDLPSPGVAKPPWELLF